MGPVIDAAGLTRVYRLGGAAVAALRGVDLRVERGEMVALMGPSGSGKSTLLNVLGCLDRPTAGTLRIDGAEVAGLDDDARSALRNERLGFVFQGFHLLPRTTALENVMLPMLYDRAGRFADPAARARAALERVGLGARLGHTPEQLSGGQQQRVAIARALVMEPAVLLADEPTGNLDSENTLAILALLQGVHREGATLVVVTHEDEVAACCTRAVVLRDVRVAEDRAVRPVDAAALLAARGGA